MLILAPYGIPPSPATRHFNQRNMQIITTKQELLQHVEACKQQNKTIGLVPTMGALHAGHASLVRRCVSENDVSFVSVFVNPTQFNNKEDLAKYPRNIWRDADLLSNLGAHFLFAPTPEEMYTAEEMSSTFPFDFNGLDQVMEGKMRRQAPSVTYKSSAALSSARSPGWRSAAATSASLRARSRQR